MEGKGIFASALQRRTDQRGDGTYTDASAHCHCYAHHFTLISCISVAVACGRFDFCSQKTSWILLANEIFLSQHRRTTSDAPNSGMRIKWSKPNHQISCVRTTENDDLRTGELVQIFHPRDKSIEISQSLRCAQISQMFDARVSENFYYRTLRDFSFFGLLCWVAFSIESMFQLK